MSQTEIRRENNKKLDAAIQESGTVNYVQAKFFGLVGAEAMKAKISELKTYEGAPKSRAQKIAASIVTQYLAHHHMKLTVQCSKYETSKNLTYSKELIEQLQYPEGYDPILLLLRTRGLKPGELPDDLVIQKTNDSIPEDENPTPQNILERDIVIEEEEIEDPEVDPRIEALRALRAKKHGTTAAKSTSSRRKAPRNPKSPLPSPRKAQIFKSVDTVTIDSSGQAPKSKPTTAATAVKPVEKSKIVQQTPTKTVQTSKTQKITSKNAPEAQKTTTKTKPLRVNLTEVVSGAQKVQRPTPDSLKAEKIIESTVTVEEEEEEEFEEEEEDFEPNNQIEKSISKIDAVQIIPLTGSKFAKVQLHQPETTIETIGTTITMENTNEILLDKQFTKSPTKDRDVITYDGKTVTETATVEEIIIIEEEEEFEEEEDNIEEEVKERNVTFVNNTIGTTTAVYDGDFTFTELNTEERHAEEEENNTLFERPRRHVPSSHPLQRIDLPSLPTLDEIETVEGGKLALSLLSKNVHGSEKEKVRATVVVKIIEAAGIPKSVRGDPFCSASLNSKPKEIFKTRVNRDNYKNPTWDEEFCFNTEWKNRDVLEINMRAELINGETEFLGNTRIPLGPLKIGSILNDWFEISMFSKVSACQLHVNVAIKPWDGVSNTVMERGVIFEQTVGPEDEDNILDETQNLSDNDFDEFTFNNNTTHTHINTEDNDISLGTIVNSDDEENEDGVRFGTLELPSDSDNDGEMFIKPKPKPKAKTSTADAKPGKKTNTNSSTNTNEGEKLKPKAKTTADKTTTTTTTNTIEKPKAKTNTKSTNTNTNTNEGEIEKEKTKTKTDTIESTKSTKTNTIENEKAKVTAPKPAQVETKKSIEGKEKTKSIEGKEKTKSIEGKEKTKSIEGKEKTKSIEGKEKEMEKSEVQKVEPQLQKPKSIEGEEKVEPIPIENEQKSHDNDDLNALLGENNPENAKDKENNDDDFLALLNADNKTKTKTNDSQDFDNLLGGGNENEKDNEDDILALLNGENKTNTNTNTSTGASTKSKTNDDQDLANLLGAEKENEGDENLDIENLLGAKEEGSDNNNILDQILNEKKGSEKQDDQLENDNSVNEKDGEKKHKRKHKKSHKHKHDKDKKSEEEK